MLTRGICRAHAFFLALALGLVLCFYLPLKIRSYACALPVQNDIRIIDHKNTSQDNKYGDTENFDQKTNGGEWFRTIFCGEMKLTDLALVFFTYCVVIVGWFTLRSNERNTESLERAYVFPGYDPLVFDDRGGVNITLVMTNAGRMPGGIKEVSYAFLNHTALPPSRKGAKIDWVKQEWDWVAQSGVRKSVGSFESSFEGDQTFVACIVYEDFFTRRRHTSRMGMYIYPHRAENERTTRGGGDAWNAWD